MRKGVAKTISSRIERGVGTYVSSSDPVGRGPFAEYDGVADRVRAERNGPHDWTPSTEPEPALGAWVYLPSSYRNTPVF